MPCQKMALGPQSRQKHRPTASVFVYLSPSGHVFNIAWQAMNKTYMTFPIVTSCWYHTVRKKKLHQIYPTTVLCKVWSTIHSTNDYAQRLLVSAMVGSWPLSAIEVKMRPILRERSMLKSMVVTKASVWLAAVLAANQKLGFKINVDSHEF